MLEIIKKNEMGEIQLTEEVSNQLAQFEKQMKVLKEQEEKIKADILKTMEVNGITKFETDSIVISYVAETYRESFDSVKFRKENNDLYNEYVKISPVKASIRIKVK